jgi:hypothetical protein
MTHWRILIVENDDDYARQVEEVSPGFVDEPDTIETDRCSDFNEAIPRLSRQRYDLLILDLRDEASGLIVADAKDEAGRRILEEVKKTRFLPTVCYTALPQHAPEQTAIVRVVEKTEGVDRLREEVRRVFSTQLPAVSRSIEEMQRAYMWDFVNENWKEFDSPLEQADLAYLLARSLQLEARRLAGKLSADAVPVSEQKIHPMEMYVRPVISTERLAGDILKGKTGDRDGFWIVLTPSCDFEQKGKLDNALLAACFPLSDQIEYTNWFKNQADNGLKGHLNSLICDNRQKAAPDRYKFLPGTFFLPDLVVDFQQLRAVPADKMSDLQVICSLDSPFGEAVLHRFARYYGRLGTQDIDPQIVINRLQSGAGPSSEPVAVKE